MQDIKRKSGSVVMPMGIDRFVNALQPLNTVSSAIDVSPRGNNMVINEESPSNVLEFKIVTADADKSADNKEVHPANTDSPMVRTDEGRVIDVMVEHPASAELPIVRSPEGRASDVRAGHPENAAGPIDRSSEGRVTDIRERHELKALKLMLVTNVGITTDVRAEQRANEAFPIFKSS